MTRLPLLWLLLGMAAFGDAAEAREWFVRQADPNASATTTAAVAAAANGSADHPFHTINAAAQLAQPGDVVTVGAGIYHEWVSPARGGTENARILYRSAPAHAAVVRGTDVLDGPWQ